MAKESDSDCESTTNSDFNFGDMTISDKEEDENKDIDNNCLESQCFDCNLNVIESKWFLFPLNNINDEESTKFHRNNKILKSKRYECELLYAQQNYKNALTLIEEIFIEFDIDSNNQYGNELTDILIRCLCKFNQFDVALKYIDKLLVRDISFGSIQLITNIYTKTNQYDKAFKYSLNLTKKEPLNSICWYQLSLCSKNIKNYDFCYVALRLLQFNIKYYLKMDRYSNSKKYANQLLKFAVNEINSIKQYLTIKQIQNYPLHQIFQLFHKKNNQFFQFLQQVCKRFNFNNVSSISYNTHQCTICNQSFLTEIDLLLHLKIHNNSLKNV